MVRMRMSMALLAGAALTGCMEASGPAPAPKSLVTTEQAVAHLDAICTATKPGFAAAPARMAALGFTEQGKDGEMAHSTQRVTAKLDTLKNGRKTCIIRATVPVDEPYEAKLRAALGPRKALYGAISYFEGKGRGKVLYGQPIIHRGRPTATYELGLVPGL